MCNGTFCSVTDTTVAAGYECLTSKQIRFLHNTRRHYPSASDHNDSMMTLSISDCDIRGILNPLTELRPADDVYKYASLRLKSFPYTHKSEIFLHFYYEKITQIWSELIDEICTDLEAYSRSLRLPIRHFTATHQTMHQLANTAIYEKISALHMCGLGVKLIDAFDYVFEAFKIAFANDMATK